MTRCNYWVGSDMNGHRCEESADRNGYCVKHYPIMLDRTKRRLEKEQAQAARAEAKWREQNLHRLPSWRAQLGKAEAEYARRTAAPVQDRAAVGGNTHASVGRAQLRHLSDSNVTRVVELERQIKALRANIARAEK